MVSRFAGAILGGFTVALSCLSHFEEGLRGLKRSLEGTLSDFVVIALRKV